MKIKKPVVPKTVSTPVPRSTTDSKPLALQSAWRATKQTLSGSASKWVAGAAMFIVATSVTISSSSDAQDKATPAKGEITTKAALTVSVAPVQKSAWNKTFSATGNVAAWQEALVGSEINGYRITSVLANVGDVVKKGQVLATLASETIEADAAQSRAGVVEAEAVAREAEGNAARAKTLEASGAMSVSQIEQFNTTALTARARVDSAKARARIDQIRVNLTRVLAPDNGVISARAAVVGSLAQPGMEHFKLIRQGRVEWRAEVSAKALADIAIGQKVRVMSNNTVIEGTVRTISPTIDAVSRNAIVYVDLPTGTLGKLSPGMFVNGEFQGRARDAITLPQNATLLRDGFNYVYVMGPANKVILTKVQLGAAQKGRVEVLSGLQPNASVVTSGAGFLSDGDTVRIGTLAPTTPDKAGVATNTAANPATKPAAK
jgi:HlyD family secretion protein